MTQECSNHHRSLSTLRSKGLSCSRMKWLPIYTNLPGNAIVRLPHPRSGDTLDQETFLAPFTDKQTCNYDTRVLKPQSLRINNKVNGIEPKQDEMVSHIYKYTSKCHSQTIPSSEIRYPGPGNVFSTLWWQANPSPWHRALKPSSSSIKPKGKGIDCSKRK